MSYHRSSSVCRLEHVGAGDTPCLGSLMAGERNVGAAHTNNELPSEVQYRIRVLRAPSDVLENMHKGS